MKDIALVLLYSRPNRYSFNALVGALETNEYFDDLDIYFVYSKSKLIANLKNITDKYEKVIVGISFFTTQLWDIYELIQQVRNIYGKKIIYLAGGPHPTGDPLGTLKMGFDMVVQGEGEETLIDVIKQFDSNNDYEGIKGIAFLDEKGDCHVTGHRPQIDLNKYPPFAVKHKKFGPIEITRGCPYVCYFCQTSYIFGTRVRHRSIERIIDSVKIMKDNNLLDIRFITPNAFSYGSKDGKNLDIDKLDELLRNVKRTIGPDGRIFIGSFPSEVRPEHVNEETIDVILRYANNDNLIIGGQSGSQRILDLCHRGHTVEDIYSAVELTLKSGLKANVDFIFGLPGETEDDIAATIKVMSDLSRIGARIHAHTFIPLPQTRFAKAPAGSIDINIKGKLDYLISKGTIYGDWVEQEKIAKKIARYLKTGDL